MKQEISKTLQSAYNEQYTSQITEWRELGAKYKADNIVIMCNNYSFNKVLECGAGEGSILKHLDSVNMFNELYAVEISDSGIEQIEKRNLRSLVEVKKFDGYQIPYPDNYFDMVYCSHVIEHVEHPRILLREIKRVSKYQVFEVPLDYSHNVDNNVKHFLSYGHINIFTPSLFKFLIKSEGFNILNERYTHIRNDVLRYSLYKNLKIKNKYYQEVKLILKPLIRLVRRMIMGKQRYFEYYFQAYTCITKSEGELKIFESN